MEKDMNKEMKALEDTFWKLANYGMIATVVGADALALLHIISPISALIAVSAVGGVAALIDHFGH